MSLVFPKVSQTGGPEQQEYILAWSSGQGARKQGLNCVGPVLEAVTETLFHASLLASGACWQSLAILGLEIVSLYLCLCFTGCSPYRHLCPFLSSYKDISRGTWGA